MGSGPSIGGTHINDRNFSVNIIHLATNEEVTFIGWLTAFSDSFSSTWNETPVYGRMDSLATFQSTQRKINLGIDVVASGRNEAHRNTEKMNKLIQFLYPVYEQGGSLKSPDQAIISAAPLLKVSYTNMIQNNLNQDGLVCYLEGVDYNPVIEAGQFFSNRSNEQFFQESALSLSFTVLHSHLTGWVKGQGKSFYFGADPNLDGRAQHLVNFPHGGTLNRSSAGASPASSGSVEPGLGDGTSNPPDPVGVEPPPSPTDEGKEVEADVGASQEEEVIDTGGKVISTTA